MSLITLLVEFIEREEISLHPLKVKNIAVFCTRILKQLYLSQDRVLAHLIIANVDSLRYLNNYRVWFFIVKAVFDFIVYLREELCHYGERISVVSLQVHVESLESYEFRYLCFCLACLLDLIVYLLIFIGVIATAHYISLFRGNWTLLLLLGFILASKLR